MGMELQETLMATSSGQPDIPQHPGTSLQGEAEVGSDRAAAASRDVAGPAIPSREELNVGIDVEMHTIYEDPCTSTFPEPTQIFNVLSQNYLIQNTSPDIIQNLAESSREQNILLSGILQHAVLDPPADHCRRGFRPSC